MKARRHRRFFTRPFAGHPPFAEVRRPPSLPLPSPSPSREVQLRPETGLSQLHLARGGGGGEGSPYQGPQNAAGAAVSPLLFLSAGSSCRCCAGLRAGVRGTMSVVRGTRLREHGSGAWPGMVAEPGLREHGSGAWPDMVAEPGLREGAIYIYMYIYTFAVWR